MEKKHIITIAGKPGSGKSTTSKALAQTLELKHFSSGDFFRAIGKERGIDVFQTNLVAESEKEIDELVDQKLRDLGADEDNMIIDSRMAWHWMPYSFRVYLDLDLEIAAKRIFHTLDAERLEAEHIPDTPDKYAEQLQQRLDSESKRYMNLYNANPYEPSNYDLVVDSANNNPLEVQEIITEAYNNWVQ
ncbi:MAG: cytidylate kinase [Candidatus Paceibacteria bacterium]|jgi:cytidylate kinase